jgi:4-hydroxy-2-oxoheptanedioate aldolase
MTPRNELKRALARHLPRFGLWQALAQPYSAEICAGLGFDWLLFDGEHAPNTLSTLLAQLQAVSRFQLEPVARPPSGDPVLIKQYLDIGFRSLLIPMVEDSEQAQRLVAATRFPPAGIRGVASSTSRAFAFGREPRRLEEAHEDICLIVQLESQRGLDSIEAIAATDGVDALFIGPADLAAALGHLGNPGNPDVQTAIQRAIGRIRAAGKPCGIFAASPEDAMRSVARGVSLCAVGSDVGLLATQGSKVLSQLRALPGIACE